MSVITTVPEPNLWEEICKEFASKRPPFDTGDSEPVKPELIDYDPAKVHPALYGIMHAKIPADADPKENFDPAVSHPALVGHAIVTEPPPSPPPRAPTPPNKDTCLPAEYLHHYVFPVLLPALEKMLEQAKVEKCFERKRTKFNALDFLTEYLYRHNPRYDDREEIDLWDIDFVKEWIKDHPRPPLPLSLVWNEEEATQKIQAFYRGYQVRKDPEIQELRVWQKEWREENENVNKKVKDFWDKQMPEGDQTTPNASEELIPTDDRPISVKSPAPSKSPQSLVPSSPKTPSAASAKSNKTSSSNNKT